MQLEVFKNLKEGDIIQNRASGNGYVITAKIGYAEYIAVKTIVISNPGEWNLKEKEK
jgi:hypothetical protein